MTMNELEQKLDCNPWDLWDSLCNAMPMNASAKELTEKFEEVYGVSAAEAMEYFGADESEELYQEAIKPI